MISFNASSFPFYRKWVYFSEKPSLRSGVFNYFKNSSSRDTVIGFRREPAYTKIIDIASENLYESLGKHNHHKIKQAKEGGVICSSTTDHEAYIAFHQKYIYDRNLSGLFSAKEVAMYGDALHLRVASLNGTKPLVYHSYLLDKSLRRVRILTSVSSTREENLTNDEKTLIANANRYLHYDDMLFFREQGFVHYDFGGYAYQTNDKSMAGINYFKDSFGGLLAEESNYEPWLIYMAKHLKEKLPGLPGRS